MDRVVNARDNAAFPDHSHQAGGVVQVALKTLGTRHFQRLISIFSVAGDRRIHPLLSEIVIPFPG